MLVAKAASLKEAVETASGAVDTDAARWEPEVGRLLIGPPRSCDS
jgi:hypothetical protein